MVTRLSFDNSAPTYLGNAFCCPHCHAYAHQTWCTATAYRYVGRGETECFGPIDSLMVSYCAQCTKYSVWVKESLLYPLTATAPMPVPDMPEDVQEDYLEARSVFDLSPKSAAALLRLGLQKLMVHLGGRGRDLNTDIGNLVRDGLPVKVQQALDAVRVIGNNAVHPGQIDLNDNKETAAALFGLINFIVEQMITQPKNIEQIYGSLPQSSRDGIQRRDGNL